MYQQQYRRLQAVTKQIEEKKVKYLFQGEIPQASGGLFFPVTLLDNPPDSEPSVSQEVFGPIRSVMTYTRLEDAIRRANSTAYGLGASVWGRDANILRSVAYQLQAGTVWINQHAALDGNHAFSGHKSSGLGIQFGIEGLKAYCNIQVIAVKQ